MDNNKLGINIELREFYLIIRFEEFYAEEGTKASKDMINADQLCIGI